MRTFNPVPKDQTNLISCPDDELSINKYKGWNNHNNDRLPDYKSKDQTTDEKCAVCDLGI